MGRLLVDCTHVFSHPEENSGIQRVVRNVVAELPNVQEFDARGVVFLNDSWHEVKSLLPSAVERRLRKARRVSKAADRMVTRLTRARLKPITPGPGDQLLLLDCSWHGDFQHTVEKLKQRGVSLVPVIHDLLPIDHPTFCQTALVEVFGRWFEWVSKSADGYLTISKTVMDDIAPRVRALANGDREPWFEFYHHGSRLDFAKRAGRVDGDLRAAFASSEPVYLAVGTIERWKNHAYALDAFDLLWARGTDVRLCIVGKRGWRADALLDRIRSHPEYRKRLFHFARLDDSSLVHAYHHARALIYPSMFEGFGLPMIEAMQHGLPVMASDIPIFHETGGDFAAYFDLADPKSLAALVERFEESGVFPADRALSEWSWHDWRTATRDLLTKVSRHAKPTAAHAQ